MVYEPAVFKNPTDKEVEIMYDRKSYIFAPGEAKIMNGEVSYHIENFLNSPLVKKNTLEVEEQAKDVSVEEKVEDYREMGWAALKKLASSRKVFKMGMTKEDIISGLEQQDKDGPK